MLNPIRVVLVDDSEIIRQRLAAMLAAVEGVEVVGQAIDVAGGGRLLRELQPDVLILDIDLPGQRGTHLLGTVKKQHPSLLVIILTNYDHPKLRRECAALGAEHYFYKPTEFEKTIEVCQNLACQRAMLPPASARVPGGNLADA